MIDEGSKLASKEDTNVVIFLVKYTRNHVERSYMEASFFLKLLLDFRYSTKGEEVYTGTPSSHRLPRLGRRTFDLPDFKVNERNDFMTLSHWLKCHFLPLQRIVADLICR